MAALTTQHRSASPKVCRFNRDSIIIGRHPECDVVIDDGSVSRRHAQILCDNGVYYLQDLESRNGTRVNNVQVFRPTRLFDGAEISVSDIPLRFHLEESSAFQNIRATMAGDSRPAGDSVVLEDDERESTVMTQLEVPSHHAREIQARNLEAKLKALIGIARALGQSVVPEEVLEDILECLFELFQEADRGFIILKDSQGAIQPMAVKMRHPEDERVRISRTIVNRVLETRRPLLSSDATEDFDLSVSLTDFKIRSIICAPLINSRDEAFGVIQLDTLRNRIAFSEDDLEVLVTVAMQASLGIQRLDLIAETLRMKELENDLRLAHEVQQSFLPQRRPDYEGFEFYSFYNSTMAVGGDYFDYVQMDEDRLAIVVADVVGHGVAAALLMAKVAAESRFALAATGCPVQAMTQINRNLSGLNLDKFVTLLIVVLDHRTDQVRIVNAGHLPPLVRRRSGESLAVSERASGLPVGILAETDYDETSIQLQRDDVLILFTDGINEALDEEGRQLGVAPLKEAIASPQTLSAGDVGKSICRVVNEHLKGSPAHDDMCLVCIRRTVD